MTTTPALNDDLVRELNEEAMRLSGRSIDRGCVDSGIAANLAEKAAEALEAQAKEIEALRSALEQAEHDQRDFLHACGEYVKQAPNPDIAALRTIRAERVRDRLDRTVKALRARTALKGA